MVFVLAPMFWLFEALNMDPRVENREVRASTRPLRDRLSMT